MTTLALKWKKNATLGLIIFFFCTNFFPFLYFFLLIFLPSFYPNRISFLFSEFYYFGFLQFLANQTEFHSNSSQFHDNQALI